MLYVTKLGPLRKDGITNIYVGFANDGLLLPVANESDEGGLREHLAHDPSGPHWCDMNLRDAGEKLGFVAVPLAEQFVEPLATVVLEMIVGEMLVHPESPQPLVEFAHAAAAFASAAPWRFFSQNDALHVELDGDMAGAFEVCIKGASSEDPGLILHAQPTRKAVATLLEELEKGARLDELSGLDFLSVEFVDAPGYALGPLDRAFGLKAIPVPTKYCEGEDMSVDTEELLALAAVLRGVSALTPARSEGCAVVSAADVSVSACVRTRRAESK